MSKRNHAQSSFSNRRTTEACIHFVVGAPCLMSQEEAEAASNPDHNKVVRVGAETRRTGVVKDKHGNIIGACRCQ